MKRMCGDRRQAGGVYLENGGGNTPIEEFILCPPVIIPDTFTLPTLGVKVFRFSPKGKPHVADRIGRKNYPYPIIWFHETRHGGLSRHVSAQVAERLEIGSCIYMAHDYAHVDNFQAYDHAFGSLGCLALKSEHQDQWHTKMCTSFFNEDLSLSEPNLAAMQSMLVAMNPEQAAEAMETFRTGNHPNLIFQDLGFYFNHPAGFHFPVIMRHPSIVPNYSSNGAFFACFPIARVVVVKSKDGSHRKTLDRLGSKIPLLVEEVDE